jgi:phage minor structural protein
MIYILDRTQVTVGVAVNGSPLAMPYFADKHTESLDDVSTYEFSVPSDHESAALLQVEGHIIIRDLDGNNILFTIKEVTDGKESGKKIKTVFAENTAVTELLSDVQRPMTMNATTLTAAVNAVMANSGTWTIGTIEDTNFSIDFSIDDHTTVLDALQQIRTAFNCELYYTVDLVGTQLVNKKVHFVEKRGIATGVRFDYQYDLKGVGRTENSEQIVTALVAVGKGDDASTRIDLTSVGTFTDGEFYHNQGTDWIGSTIALNNWGFNGKHRFGVYIDDESETVEKLKERTMKELADRSQPVVTYSSSITNLERITGYEAKKLRLGDTIVVNDKSFSTPIVISARVKQIVRSYTNPAEDEVDLGNYVPLELWVDPRIKALQQKISMNEAQWNAGELIIKQPTQPEGTFKDGQLWLNTETNVMMRYNASTGAWEKVTRQDFADLAGQATESQIANDAISRDKLIDGAVTGSKLGNGSVSEVKIRDLSVTSAKIAQAAIQAAHIEELAVGTAAIQDLAVTTAKIASLAVGTAQIQDASINNAKIATAAIGSANIIDGTITNAKIANASIDTAKIKDASITNAKMGTASIDTANIKDAAIQTAKIGDAQITSAKIANLAVGTAQIADASIATAKIIDASITNAKLGTASVDTAKIKDASITNAKIDRASVNKLVVVTADIADANITNAKIANLAVDSAKIADASITNAKIGALAVDSAKIKDASITTAKIASAAIDTGLIKDGAITSAKIQDASISTAKIADASIVDAKIANLSANKISTGTFDANKVTVINLKADSIVAGSLTIDGDNKLKNSEFKSGTDYFDFSTNVSVDTSVTFDGSNTAKSEQTGLTADGWRGVGYKHRQVNTTAGQTWVASVYAMTDDLSTFDGGATLEINYYDVNGTRISGWRSTSAKPTANNEWQRFTLSSTAPAGTDYVRIYFYVTRNGRLWFARPMLQKGSVASEWKPHTDEIISEGAIDNSKLADGAVATDNIQDSAITNGKVANASIDTAKIATAAITTALIKDAAITSAKIQDATIGTAKIADASITNAKIGNLAVSNAKIDWLDAVKITAGTLNADRIGANTITAKKLMISDFTNLVENPDFENDGVGTIPKGWYLNSGGTYARVADISAFQNGNGSNRAFEIDGLNGSNSDVFTDLLLPVSEGQEFYLEGEGRYLNTDGTGYAFIGVREYDAKKVHKAWNLTAAWNDTTKNTTFIKKYGTYVVPAGVSYIQFRFSYLNSGVTTNKFYLDNLRFHRRANSELIVDGAITATKLAVDSVTANSIKAGTITATEIKDSTITGAKLANSVITDSHIVNGTITGTSMANSTITGTKIATSTITDSNILNGTIQGASIKDATLTGAKIADATITDAKIANATISSAKIASLDAGKITTGILDSNRIGADSITAKQILVGNWDNLFQNADFEKGSAGWKDASIWSVATNATNAYIGNNYAVGTWGSASSVSYYNDTVISVRAGEKYYIEGFFKTLYADSTPARTVLVKYIDKNGVETWFLPTETLSTTWTKFSYTFTIPDGTVSMQIGLSVKSGMPPGNATWVDNLYCRKMISGELLVDGSVTADTIKSLNGLNVGNGQFKVDANGNVTLGAGAVLTSVQINSSRFESLRGNTFYLGDTGAKIDYSLAGSINRTRYATNDLTYLAIDDTPVFNFVMNGAFDVTLKPYGQHYGLKLGSPIIKGLVGADTVQIRNWNDTDYGGIAVKDVTVTNSLDVWGTSALKGVTTISASSGGMLKMVGTADAYAEFYPDGTSAGRKGFIGMESATGNNFIISSDANEVLLRTNATRVKVDDGVAGVYIRNSADSAYAPIYASAFTVNSLKDSKKDITPFEQTSMSRSALDEILDTTIYNYRLNEETEVDPVHVGLIYEESPMEVVDLRGKGIDSYAMIALSWQGLKDLNAKLENKVAALEERLAKLEGGTN